MTYGDSELIVSSTNTVSGGGACAERVIENITRIASVETGNVNLSLDNTAEGNQQEKDCRNL